MSEKQNKDITIRIRVTDEENEKIEKLAEKMKMNKSKLIRNLVLGSLDDATLLDNFKVIPLIQNMMALRDKVRGIDYWDEIKKEPFEK